MHAWQMNQHMSMLSARVVAIDHSHKVLVSILASLHSTEQAPIQPQLRGREKLLSGTQLMIRILYYV